MDRGEWNDEYAKIISEIAGLDEKDAMYFAGCADDAFSDGDTPQDAVDSELSYWGE